MRGAVTLLLLALGPAQAQDDACHKALEARVSACVAQCVASAWAAVDPDLRDQVNGAGCRMNCLKLEMFNGHACPPG